MKLCIFNHSDTSIGIPPYNIEIDLGDIEGLGDKDYRSNIRYAAHQLGETITGQVCQVLFEDEIRRIYEKL